jgi:O-antigen/teichoic acid export membrane protein
MSDLLVTFLSRGGAVIVGLATQSLLAWRLGPEGRGEYAICLVFGSISAVVFGLGVDWATTYYISTKRYSYDKIVTFSLIYAILSSSISLIFLPFIIDIKIAFFEKVDSKALAYTIFWSCSLNAYNLCNSILSGMRQFIILAKLMFFKVFFSLSLTFFLFNTTNLGVRAPIFADMVSCLLTAIAVIFLLIIKFKYRWKLPGFELYYKLLSYAIRFFGGSLGMIANARIATILLTFYVDKESLGIFALASSFLYQLLTISDVTATIIQPRVAVSQYGRPDLISLSSRIIGASVLFLGIVLIVFSHIWVPILFSIEFLPIIPILMILMPGIWFRVIGKILFPFFNGTNRPGIVSTTTTIHLTANIIFLLIFLSPYGLEGAAWATTISFALSTVYAIYKYLQISGDQLLNLLFLKPIDFKVFINQFFASQTN